MKRDPTNCRTHRCEGPEHVDCCGHCCTLGLAKWKSLPRGEIRMDPLRSRSRVALDNREFVTVGDLLSWVGARLRGAR